MNRLVYKNLENSEKYPSQSKVACNQQSETQR